MHGIHLFLYFCYNDHFTKLSSSKLRASQLLFRYLYLNYQLSPVIHVQHLYSRFDKLYYIITLSYVFRLSIAM